MTEKIQLFTVVRLITDRFYQEHGVSAGDIGTVVSVYDESYDIETGYELEFLEDATGHTKALFACVIEDIEPCIDPGDNSGGRNGVRPRN